MHMFTEEKSALVAFITNILLFIMKISAALASGSLAMLSSAFDSLNDVVSYALGYYSTRMAAKGPDRDHPFGHRAMEPVSGMVMAILAGILAFEVIRTAFLDLLLGEHLLNITAYTFFVLIVTIAVKLISYLFLKKKAEKTMSAALDAMMVDSKNDVLSNLIAIIGIGGASMGIVIFDDIAAIMIAIYIAYSGYQVARKNYNYMMGARPDDKIMKEIGEKAMVTGVKQLGRVRAHYVGDRVHAEIDVILPKKTTAKKSHDIGVEVEKSVESIKVVSRAFVHIDYG